LFVSQTDRHGRVIARHRGRRPVTSFLAQSIQAEAALRAVGRKFFDEAPPLGGLDRVLKRSAQGCRKSGCEPWRFVRADEEPFVFAGLWEFARIAEEEILSLVSMIACR
jgi:hypothetical protein